MTVSGRRGGDGLEEEAMIKSQMCYDAQKDKVSREAMGFPKKNVTGDFLGSDLH